MRQIKLFMALFAISFAALFFYACAKDNTIGNIATVQSRSQNLEMDITGGECTPADFYPFSPGCFPPIHKMISLDFSFGQTLYSNSSLLYQLCPGVQFSVEYDYQICNSAGGQIHFVYNIKYKLSDITSQCPALTLAINQHVLFGDIVTFLDQIDEDISKQIEFTQAIADIQTYGWENYDCSSATGGYYSIKIINSSCYSWQPYNDGPISMPIPAYKKVPCDGHVCCIRHGYYCVSGVYEGIPVLQGSANTTYGTSIGTCPANCTHECGQDAQIPIHFNNLGSSF
jgi:hypothetical protein